LVIILAHRIDILLELDAIVMTAAVFLYIVKELVSITENLGRSGIPLPPKVVNIIDVLKTKGNVKSKVERHMTLTVKKIRRR